MTTKDEQLKDLNEIRSIMERSTRFISLSGLSGVFAGIYALIGAVIAWWILGYGSPGYVEGVTTLPDISHRPLLWHLFLDATIVLLFALGTSFFLSYRKALKKGHPLWSKSTRRLLFNLFIPLTAGGVFCLILFINRDISLVISLSLIFYGLALFSASNFTLDEVRYLGLADILCGILALIFPAIGLVFWAIGFGLFHIIYGLVMHIKYDR
jgi:hypothetical protein